MFKSRIIWLLVYIALVYCAYAVLNEHYGATLVCALVILLLFFIELKMTRND